jgi:hypothetical protein
MKEPKAAPAARVAAAQALLDRGWGKPMQAMEHSGPDGNPIEGMLNVNLSFVKP